MYTIIHLSTTIDSLLNRCRNLSAPEGNMSCIGWSSDDACASTVADWTDPSTSGLTAISMCVTKRVQFGLGLS